MNSDADSIQNTMDIPTVRQVPPEHILRWVKLGWRDFVDTGWLSLYWPILPGATISVHVDGVCFGAYNFATDNGDINRTLRVTMPLAYEDLFYIADKGNAALDTTTSSPAASGPVVAHRRICTAPGSTSPPSTGAS